MGIKSYTEENHFKEGDSQFGWGKSLKFQDGSTAYLMPLENMSNLGPRYFATELSNINGYVMKCFFEGKDIEITINDKDHQNALNFLHNFAKHYSENQFREFKEWMLERIKKRKNLLVTGFSGDHFYGRRIARTETLRGADNRFTRVATYRRKELVDLLENVW